MLLIQNEFSKQVGGDKVHILMVSLIQLDEEKIMKSCSELEILLETTEVYSVIS